MPVTYDNIATTTLGTASANITFSSIPATYTDLRLVLVSTASSGGSRAYLRFNSDTGTNYSFTNISGDGGFPTSARATSQAFINLDAATYGQTTATPNFYSVDIFSYAGSTNKTVLSTSNQDQNTTNGSVVPQVSLWRSTSAINTVTLSLSSGNYAIGTTATLYGIKNA